MNSDLHIKNMVNRFLGWKLPEDFSPDCGISFKKNFNEGTTWPMKNEPIGTNLLDATQAKAMLEYVASDLLSEVESFRGIIAGLQADYEARMEDLKLADAKIRVLQVALKSIADEGTEVDPALFARAILEL